MAAGYRSRARELAATGCSGTKYGSNRRPRKCAGAAAWRSDEDGGDDIRVKYATPMSGQPEASRKGEIQFRRKLVSQQIGGETALENEYDAEGIEKLLRDRMRVTLERMSSLRSRGIPLSPHLPSGVVREVQP